MKLIRELQIYSILSSVKEGKVGKQITLLPNSSDTGKTCLVK